MGDAGGLSIGGGAFGATAGVIGSVAQNESIRSAGSADVAGARLQYGQIDEAAALEVRKRANDAHRVRSRLRVLAADSGLGFTGSYQALEDQALRDQRINEAVVQQNAYNEKLNLASRLKANLIRLFSGTTSPLTAGLQGGMQGFETGLRIEDYLRTRPPSFRDPFSPKSTKVDSAYAPSGSYA